MVSAYDELPRPPQTFVALSPLRYLERAAHIIPIKMPSFMGTVIFHGVKLILRCRQFASQLQKTWND